MLESLRIDLRPLGITCATVCPGFVRTDLTAKNTFPDAVPDRGRRRGPPDLPTASSGEGRDRLPVPMMLAMKQRWLLPIRPWTALMARQAKTRKR